MGALGIMGETTPLISGNFVETQAKLVIDSEPSVGLLFNTVKVYLDIPDGCIRCYIWEVWQFLVPVGLHVDHV